MQYLSPKVENFDAFSKFKEFLILRSAKLLVKILTI